MNKIKQFFIQHRSKIRRTTVELLIAILVLWILLTLGGKSLCKRALKNIAQATNTKITTQSIKLGLDGTIVLKGLTIKNADEGQILNATKVRTDIAIGSLLTLKPRLKRIIISDFIFNLRYDQDKKIWNLPALKAFKSKGGGKIPLIRLNNGRLIYEKAYQGREKTAVDISFNSTISANKPTQKEPLSETKQAICFFEITTEPWLDFGKTRLIGCIEPNKAQIDASIWQSSNQMIEPVTTEDLKAALEFKENLDYSLRLDIKKLTSRKRSIEGGFEKLMFLFPEQIGAFQLLQDVFNRFRPGGQIDLNIEFWGNLKDLNNSKLMGQVQCRDVWVMDRNFEYRIENLKGSIDVRERSAVLQNLTGKHGEVELLINGWTTSIPEGRQHQFRITSDNMLLDNDLYNALKPEQQKVWDDFNPTGKAAINQLITRKGSNKKESILNINLLAAQAQWKTFPYPLKNLTGQLTFDSNQIIFNNVISQSEDEQITVNGKVTSYDEPKPLYDIEIRAENIASNIIKEDKYQESLAKLLSGYFLDLVREIKVEGKNNCLAHFNNLKNREKTNFTIELDCLGNKIEHTKFSYPVRDVRGKIKIENESITLRDVTGTIAGNIPITEKCSTVIVTGLIKTQDNKFSEANLRLDAEDMSFDERLRLILPPGIRDTYSGIAPTGRFDIGFDSLKITANNIGEKYFDFNSVMTLKDCNFRLTLPVTEFTGPIRVKGLYKSGYGFVEGLTIIEGCDMRIENEKLTEMRADINYDTNKHTWQCNDLTSTCYGGRIMGKIQLQKEKDKEANYLLDIGFHNIDLKKFLEDSKVQQNENQSNLQAKRDGHTGGNMNGSLCIEGSLGNKKDRIGRCRLRITDMQVGRLSPIAKLLYILNLTEPRDFAFEQMVLDSYIQGSNMILKKVDFSGKALAFNGMGNLNLEDFNIDLILAARGQRLSGTSPGVIQSLGESLGQGIVQVDVEGNLYDPQVKVRTLPIIQDTLQILGAKEKK